MLCSFENIQRIMNEGIKLVEARGRCNTKEKKIYNNNNNKSHISAFLFGSQL